MKDKVNRLYKLRKMALADALGREELIGQLTEECCEAGQAAQKVRRAMHGTTPVSIGEAVKALNEEVADVLVCIEVLAESGLLDIGIMRRTAKIKMNRWYKRTFLLE